MSDSGELFVPRLRRRRRMGVLFAGLCIAMTFFGIGVLAILVLAVLDIGAHRLSWEFLNRFPSQLEPESSGIKSALWGTFWVIGLTSVFAIPVGIAAAIYLHEFAGKSQLTRFIELNISNLAGVPSIVYGILGLALFIRMMHLGRSVLSGAFTLALLVLPVIIIASREALAAVPDSFRYAAYGLGATRWQTVWSHVLPPALPGIMTGIILAVSRAIGEAAPLIMIGALTYIAFVPEGLRDDFTAMPIQIYNWVEQPEAVFRELAAAGILVLLGMLFPLNALAMGIRAWHARRKTW